MGMSHEASRQWQGATQVGSKDARDFVGMTHGHSQVRRIRGKTIEALVEEALDKYGGEIVIDRACFGDAECGFIVYVADRPGKACGNLLTAMRSAMEAQE